MSLESDVAKPSARAQTILLACLGLAAFAVYARTLACDFVYYDDGLYVFDNAFVRDGFSVAGIKHIFVTGETGTWQPIALLSHMTDCQLFGLRAWGHHLSAIVLHAANAVLLAIALMRLTGRYYASLAVAALFALHPAHVESVAWVSERKDVLSTFFWMLCLLTYERYARRGGWLRYVILSVLLALGLMTKPMLVTLPCVLLLLDFWPLRRLDRGAARLVLEKVPLFALAAGSCVVTLIVQRQSQAIVSLENLSLASRLGNVIVSYVRYVTLMLWPSGLAIDYPHPKDTLTALQVVSACAVLAALTIAAGAARRRAPYATVGWFWYLGTLVPVIGFVHVGEQGMADRYTYIPTIGLAIAVIWAVDAWIARKESNPSVRRFVAGTFFAVLAVYAVMTWTQIGYWKDTESLWTRAVAVNSANERAQRNLGSVYMDQHRYARAIPHLEAATRLNPGDPRTLHNLAFAQQQTGNISVALELFTRASEIDPKNIDTRNNIGLCLLKLGRDADALQVLQEAARMAPSNPEVASNLGVALCKTGRANEAVTVLREAVRRHPDIAKLHNNLGIACSLSGNPEDAIAEFREVLRIDPADSDAQRNLKALGG